MSLYYYNEEEDKKKEGEEESIDKYVEVFKEIKKNPPSLEEALKEMYIKTGSTEIEAEDLKEDIISECKKMYKKKENCILENILLYQKKKQILSHLIHVNQNTKQKVHTEFLIKI